MKIAYIPQDAPFNEDQRAWLSGFLAGLHSRLAMNVAPPPAAVADAPASRPPLRILYGTQTGNAEGVANDAAAAAKLQGFDVKVSGLDEIELDEFAGLKYVLIVTSTYGEGEMPDNAELFWEALSATTAPRLEGVSYGVLALGDTSYDEFCQAGKLFDIRLEQLGATRVVTRTDCDVEYEAHAAEWIQGALTALVPTSGASGTPSTPPPSAVARSGWTRKNPFVAELAVNRLLSGPGSDKEIRHFEFDLADSGIEYEAGDALAVIPENDPALVEAIAEHFRVSPDTLVGDRPLGELLGRRYEISAPSKDLLGEVEKRADNEELSHVLRGGVKETLERWLYGKDILDVLRIAGDDLSLEEFIDLLKPLAHRAYSISSSALAHPDRIHLTVASVRYRSNGRARGGVCSTFLADRSGTAKIFLQPNKSFRVPADGDVPMIMVGPGTGVAPFRAFLQEREHSGAQGRNWLFFGDQHREHDFAYADELQAWQAGGLLTRLDLAFSRDQAEKVYVQSKMLAHGAEVFAWLEEGGHFYVCGDATRMAKDVDKALHQLVSAHGGMSSDAATEYVNSLKREKRYVRDVY
ncbi:sulfite reductase subunit alpha [Mycolicibacterium bacteremicum]|uniref:assimilatory sulfite reductase (NADPH) n=1 Tax=Mycolicibacterium bacteremicum TaxID=564198 RepID=A0A1W9Z0B8_MYCBA|nr:sulfite reductase subunit alpha [Mycolicibacterium bacteremicum]MCV7434699.1 sulfite reductase subunit alpha [Mycolicibacterium bacteremicum]ORA05707.1 sulfite reductase subunit alpha [Mycolicibacterium bacteremicum]